MFSAQSAHCFPLCPTSEFAEYHRQRPPSGKRSVWWRRGRRNLYHHRASDKQSSKGQNSSASLPWCSNMRPILRGGTAKNRCVVVLQLLAVDGCALGEALTHKKLTAKGEEVTLSSFFLMHLKKRFLFADWDFSSVLSAFSDGQCTQFRAGGVIPWRSRQGHVQSNVHVAGGEDQPIACTKSKAPD